MEVFLVPMRKILYLLLIMLVALGAACSQVAEEVTPAPTATPSPTLTSTPTPTLSPAPTATSVPTPTPTPIVGSDDYGRPFTLQRIPQRIISLAPSNTELLFALGLDEEIAGVTDFVTIPVKLKI